MVVNYQTHLSLLEEQKKSEELQEQNSFKLAIDNIVSTPQQQPANGHSSPSNATTLVDPSTTNDTITE